MNHIDQIRRVVGIAGLLLVFCVGAQAQTDATCNLSIGGVNYPIEVSVPSTALTGQDFILSLTLPGFSTSCAGNYDVSITTSNNLLKSSGGTVPFTGTFPTYTNAALLPNDIGRNILIPFKFKPGVTCKNEKGNFDITVKIPCNGQTYTCTLKVSITADAKNYWQLKKSWLWGDLSGGAVLWKISLTNTNPNPGIGDYNIASGTITDLVDCGVITSLAGATGVGTNTATLNVGNIPSTSNYREWVVTTVCCKPAGTLVENSAQFSFNLGKAVGPCDTYWGIATCPKVTLKGAATYGDPFWKGLTISQQSNQLNYAQGCEGEYYINISNNGNVPITNFVMNDIFPSGIQVTNISMSSSGQNMAFTTNFGTGVPATGSGNVGTYQSWVFTTPPSKIDFSTSSGSLTYGTITIRIRFNITAAVGTVIENCANLKYDGTLAGWAGFCPTLPNVPPATPSKKCVSFTVEQPKAIPGLRKCIIGPQSYLIGEKIPICITVSNHGSANMSGYTLNDLMSSPQNLEIIPSSITYASGIGAGYYPGNPPPCCIGVGTASTVMPSWVTANLSNLQNPSWTINGMPGDCRYDYASYLVIKFEAIVKPQNYGPYTNIAKLISNTTPGTPITSTASYTVLRIAEIKTSKLVNNGPGQPFAASGFVNAGAAFQYLLRIENSGSVGLNNLRVEDVFPSCVKYTCSGVKSCTTYYANGTVKGTATVTCTTTSKSIFTVTPATTTLAPGEYLDIIVDVTRLNTAQEPCCNQVATGYGQATDAGAQKLQDEGGPVCVQKSICCDLDQMQILTTSLIPQFTGGYYNFGLNVSAGNLPIQEVEVSLVDYHFSYTNTNCQPTNVGNLTGHIRTSTQMIGGGLNLATPNTLTTNSLLWKAGTPVLFNSGQLIRMHIIRPSMLAIPCCSGKLYYCVKVRLKDAKCRICEKIVCFTVDLGPSGLPIGVQEKVNIFEKDIPFIEGN